MTILATPCPVSLGPLAEPRWALCFTALRTLTLGVALLSPLAWSHAACAAEPPSEPTSSHQPLAHEPTATAALPSEPTSATVAPDPAFSRHPTERRYGFGALPIPNFTSDFGMGLGLVGSLFHFSDGYRPYHWDLDAGIYVTTGGIRVYGLLSDFPHLLGSEWRLNTMVAYNRNLGAAFYGIGNQGRATPGQSARYNYYDLEDPTIRVYFRRPIWRSLLFYIGLRLTKDVVNYDANSLVAAMHPYGIAGGNYNQINAGFAWDSRDNEHNPGSGTLLEVSGRTAAPWLGSAYQTYSVYLSASWYHTLMPRLILATRVAFDRQWGDVPFTHLDDIGGLYPASGLGGGNTLRGALSDQFIGKVKALGNIEGRYRLVEFQIRNRPLEFDVVGFYDVGRVWASDGGDGPTWNIHQGVGGGLRMIWDHVFVIRADSGFADGGYRVYVDAWQAF